MTIWTNAKSADLLILKEGAAVSVATVTMGGNFLKWKRADKDGNWPPDSAAVLIATLASADEFALDELSKTAGGAVLIGNGEKVFYRTKTNDPKSADDFEAVSVLNG